MEVYATWDGISNRVLKVNATETYCCIMGLWSM